MTRFYVAKVIKSGGRRSHAITLFAESEEEARSKVAASGHGYGHVEIYVADIEPESIGGFGRYVDDGNGIVEHSNLTFHDDGPIDTAELFNR
ncbi:hypothetical protein [Rhizobium leguminosarum]|uniref:hypothetical protein n=1 Tax=Rhizobium leguminosarum TaxID=384 RepID=UPI0014416ABC|nr:hypothetical protein [Rhizobium leguminosarum]NKK79751.1 hypothetical protein [Rhizobium leguminosarum bv. viciae]